MDHQYQRRKLLKTAGALSVLAVSPAWAQSTWPTRPVVLIVPFPAGGGTDAFARPLSAALGSQIGKQIVVDNKGGAGGNLGASAAAKATPDGYTLFMGAVHHSIAPSMYPNLDYSIQKDFVPLALVASVPQVLVVNPGKFPGDYKQFLEEVKKNPGKYNFGSAGSGTSHHLAGELFKIQTKTDIVHIPYKGAGPALKDLIAGQVDMMFDGLGSSAQHIKSGRIKALMVAGDERNPAFPDVPSAKELGLPDYNVTTWYGLWAPKGTPVDVQNKILADLKTVKNQEMVVNAWAQNGAQFPDVTGAAYGKFVDDQIKLWSDVVIASGAKLD